MARKRPSGTMADTSGILTIQCYLCKHLARNNIACAAFPSKIPDEVLSDRWDHRHPWIDPETGEPGDVGMHGDDSILFEPNEYATPARLARLEEDLSNWARNYGGPVSAALGKGEG